SIDGTHHWYSTPLVLLEIYLLAKDRNSPRIALAGFLLGVATLFTSTRGVFVAIGIALFFFWELQNRRKAFQAITTLLVPLIAVAASALIYLALLAGPRVLYNSLIVFPLRYYSAGAANSFSVYYSPLQAALPFRPLSILLILQWLA